MIPNNIIQFWDDSSTLPSLLKKCMAATHKNNPSAKVIVADDLYMKDFIEKYYSKAVAKLYNLNRLPASRADIARLMLLYEFGGFYIDVSIEVNEPITNLIEEGSDVILVRRDDFPQYKNTPENAHVINGIIGVRAKSKFIKWCIQRVLRNLASDDTNKQVHFATGPIVINQALRVYESSLNIKLLSFKQLNDSFFYRRRVAGVNNTWTQEQQHGIIDPVYYRNNSKRYEKTFVLMNRIFHISFCSLALKESLIKSSRNS